MVITVDDCGLEWNRSDGIVHKADYDDLIEAYEALKKYKDAEEQGLLLRLPCKVGDTVWCIFEKKIYKAIAMKVTIVTGLRNYKLVKIEAEFEIVDLFYRDGRMMKHAIYGNYLENFFFTKAEAEKALKKMEG